MDRTPALPLAAVPALPPSRRGAYADLAASCAWRGGVAELPCRSLRRPPGLSGADSMGKVTIGATAIATTVLLVTFYKGMLALRGGADMMSHLQWSVATLILVLSANVIAMVHAARSDRLIAE